MKKYTQISLQERIKIFGWLCAGMSRRWIAKNLDRAPSSISREFRRNSDSIGYLCPREAHEKTKQRKGKHGFKVARNKQLKEYAIECLHNFWSPIAIAGRWSKDRPEQKITSEAIYAWIYSEEGIRLELPVLLPRAKRKRGKMRTKKSKSHIPKRTSIHIRPDQINQRDELGHLEGDLVFNKGSQSSNVLTLIDRKSRFVMLTKNESKRSEQVINATLESGKKSGAKSITFDNGSEFAGHTKLTEQFGIPTYFCDPGSPWQKGSVENMNKQLRRFIPFSLSAADITQERLDQIAHVINNIPRKILGFCTPAEVHFGESRVKLARPAMEASFSMKFSSVALRC